MREELRSALALAASRLPGTGLVFYTRAPMGDLRFTWTAGPVEEITGHPADVFTAGGGSWTGILHPGDRNRVLSALSVLTKQPLRDEMSLCYRVATPDGEERWLQDDVKVLRSVEGTPTELLGVLRDVTEERRRDRQISVLEERLWEAQRMESLGSLAGGIAHDFNNLLTAILSAARMVDEEGVPPPVQEDVEVIQEAARRGAAMVRQILDFAGREASAPEIVGLDNVVRGMEAILNRTLGDDVGLEVRMDAALPSVRADPARLEQVVLNLVVNAREAMSGGGRMSITAQGVRADGPLTLLDGELPPGEYVRLTVRDDGPGIPEHIRDRIFEPFFSTKRRGDGQAGGSGVGLATVQRIVRGYGGDIAVESGPGEGAAFHIYFPVADAEAVASPERVIAEAVREAGADHRESRILVVEDDPRVREIVERTLRTRGHLVVGVSTAEEGLQVFDRVRPPFQLLVSDVVLPDRPGPQLYRALTRRVPSLPVLYISGYGEEMLTRRGGEPGVFFLAKPFTPEKLLDRVEQVLDAAGRGADEPEERETGAGA